MPDGIVRTVGEMLRVVTPVLGEILTAEELAATSLRAVRQPIGQPIPPPKTWPSLQDSDRLDENTLLELHTFDDRRGSWMQGIETATDMRTRFRSKLQDYVAESTFGWGQWRPCPPSPVIRTPPRGAQKPDPSGSGRVDNGHEF